MNESPNGWNPRVIEGGKLDKTAADKLLTDLNEALESVEQVLSFDEYTLEDFAAFTNMETESLVLTAREVLRRQANNGVDVETLEKLTLIRDALKQRLENR